MKNSDHCHALACILGIFGACAVLRAQESHVDFKEAITEAAVIVIARVHDLRPAWVDDVRGRHIRTVVDLHIQTTLKGKPPSQTITLRTIGGTVDDITEVVSSSTSFLPEEQCLLLLKEGAQELLGGQRGKISLSQEKVFYGNILVSTLTFVGIVERYIKNPNLSEPFDQLLRQAVADSTSTKFNRSHRFLDPSPVILSVSPSRASAGTSTLVTVQGRNFQAAQGSGKVEFFFRSGNPVAEAQVTAWCDTQIVCLVPSVFSSNASSGPLVVTTSGGLTSNPYTFKIVFSYKGVSWAGTSPRVNYLVNENYAQAAGLRTAIQNAADTWNNAGASFTLSYGGSHTATTTSMNGLNEILWGTTDGSLATTYWWYRGLTILETDMVFNTSFLWSTAATPDYQSYDVETLALHEFGHFFVLCDIYGDIGDNTYDRGKAMYGFRSKGQIQRTLHADDVEGIRWIYAVPGTQLPTPVISPSSGSLSPSITVTIVCSAPGVTLRYTLDGSEPTTSSAVYVAPLTLTSSSTIVLKANAYKNGWLTSGTASAQFTYSVPATPPDSWTFRSSTGKNAVIAVNASIGPRIGSQALRSGDAIGVFFRRNDSLLCAGYSIWQGQNAAITAWGDDDQTTMKDGFAEGDAIYYKLWDSQARTMYDATAQYAQGSGTFVSNGIYVLSSLVGGVSANQKPVFVTRMRDTMIAQNQTLSFTFGATDANNDALTFHLVNAPLGATITAGGTFSWKPTYAQSGAFLITVLVSDGLLNDTAKATVTVAKVNQKPLFVTKMRDTTIAQEQMLSFTYAASDPNNDVLSYGLLNAPPGASITSGGVLSWKPTTAQLGGYAVIAVVSDGSLADTARSIVTVIAAPAAPPNSWSYRSNTGKNSVVAVNASINPRIGNQGLQSGDAIGVFFMRNDSLVCAGCTIWQGQNTAITVWGDDDQTALKDGFAEGEVLNFKLWEERTGKVYDATVQYAQGNETFTSNGIYVLSSLAGIVSVNQKPAFVTKMRDTTIAPNQLLRFTYAASDPNSDAVTFSLVHAPPGATITTAGIFSWTPTSSQVGSFLITVVVSDGSLTDTAKATVTVTKSNQKPVFVTRMRDTTIAPNQLLRFAYAATDPDSDTLTFSLTNAPSGATVTIAGVFLWTPTSGQVGSFLITALVSDGSLTDTARSTVTVVNADTVLAPPASWTYRSNTGRNCVIAVNTSINPRVGNQSLRAGDAIGVFFRRNEDLICAGCALWQGQNTAITVWGDDDQTGLKDGFAEGETMNFVLWDARGGKAFNATVSYAQGTSAYSTNGIYVLSSLIGSTAVSIAEDPFRAVTEYSLSQNFPNPFNPATSISYQVTAVSIVKLEIIDVLGQTVATLDQGIRQPGSYTVRWDASGFPSAMYLCRFLVTDPLRGTTRIHSEWRKMILMK